MDNESQNLSNFANSSHRSSFHKQNQQKLIKYLVNEFGYSQQLAKILIHTHKCNTIAEMFELFIKDQNGHYGHVYIQNQETKVCRICQGNKNEHNLQIYPILKYEIENQEDQYLGQEKMQCQICYIDYYTHNMVKINDRTHGVCKDCMNQYLKEQIMSLRVEKMRCPHCGEALNPITIQQFVDGLTFSKYKGFLRNLQIQKNPNLRWCPNPKCSVVIKVKNKNKKIKCPKCFIQICSKCNREAHPTLSCQAIFKNQIKQWENASDVQKCKKCSAIVQKISGCNHMSCSVCHYQWCWLCGATYSQTHFSPLNPFGCPGLQDGSKSEWGKCRIILWRILMMLLIIILVPIVLPLSMILVGPVWLINYFNRGYRSRCKKALIVLICIPLGIVIDPLVWIGIIIYYIPKLIGKCSQYFERRRQINRYSQDLLRQRLLRQNSTDLVSAE